MLDFGGSITTSMTGTYNASSNYWNVINTTGTFGSTFFQPYMEVQTSQYNSTGAVYIPSSSFSSGSLLGQTVVQ